MYQHLSETAKDVLKSAQKLAREQQQEFVGTEHVLIAIVSNGVGLGAQILQSFSITLPAVQEQISILLKDAMDETWVLGRLPGSPHFKQVIALAIEEAEKFKDSKVGTEYLLLGLIREKDCIAQKALRNLGVTINQARIEMAKLQGRPLPGENIAKSRKISEKYPVRYRNKT